ncbi:MAG: hypothetical protein BECKG1743D_GA0114223_106533 [Candidatus Kentron sp. G]|nr:MAG: hypothetical protein BECKG1743F_GA0114225_106572 [Candidatus Kentron sp. G]VFN03818.1 MAG: hypothetical protein BECKG1743E_GA0114224_106592 [Candidatus Kentron sp. G]VFN04961.1 MAG: hypothetical protein BECKG1743D_GA0114223_106533 [Candidatus Kentron sp. G]
MTKEKTPAEECDYALRVACHERMLGDLDKAVRALEEELAKARAAGLEAEGAELQRSLGQTWAARGHADKAISHHREALTLFRRTGQPNREAIQARDIGRLYLKQGRAGLAKASLELAIKRSTDFCFQEEVKAELAKIPAPSEQPTTETGEKA